MNDEEIFKVLKELLFEQKKTNDLLEKINGFWLAMSQEFPGVPDVSYHEMVMNDGIVPKV